MGYFIFRVAERPAKSIQWPRLALYVFAANAPDLDFIPGLFLGEPGRFHHGPSHSLGFAVVFGLTLGTALALGKLGDSLRYSMIMFSLYFSHVLLDYLGNDTRAPFGVPLFWPLSDEYYISPAAIFLAIRRPSFSGVAFVTGLFSSHNLLAITVEFLLLWPLAWLTSDLNRQKIFMLAGFQQSVSIDERNVRRDKVSVSDRMSDGRGQFDDN